MAVSLYPAYHNIVIIFMFKVALIEIVNATLLVYITDACAQAVLQVLMVHTLAVY